MQFTYRAKQDPRTEASGVIDAVDFAAAVTHLKRMGLYPLEVVPLEAQKNPFTVLSQQPLLSRMSLALWARTIGQGLQAGLTLTQALHLLAEQEGSRPTGQAAKVLEERVTAGMTLANSMQQMGRSFTPVAINLVKAGETSGALEQVLHSLAVQMESEADLIAKVRGALIYPLFVLTVGIGTIAVLLWVVVPKLALLFAETGQPLPAATKFLISSGRGLVWIAGASLVGAAIGFWIIRRKRWGPLLVQKAMVVFSHVPLFGRLTTHAEVARLCAPLGLLLEHGLPLPEALRLGAGTVSPSLLRRQIQQCEREVIEGMSLSASLRRVGIKEAFLLTMVAMGEVQGDLARSFTQAGARYGEEVDRGVKVLSTLIEPMMILFVGLIVVGIVFSMLLPIFQINFTVG